MKESEIASTQLSTMINDVEAGALFAKGGPLYWFFLERTYASAFSKGTLTEKQIPLIFSVYEQLVHIGHFNDAELIIGELPIENRIAIWEVLHSARRAYLVELYGHA